MAPKRRAARHADIASSVLPSIETDGNPTPPPAGSSNSAETTPPQRYKSWTPGPSKVLNPRDKNEVAAWEKKCLDWDQKHFGERYYELNEAYLHEKDHLQDPLKYYDMWKEMRHIEAEKTTEHEREKKAALGDQYVRNPFVRLSESDDDNGGDTDSNSDKSEPMPDDPWERLEYARRHLRLYQSEEDYQAARARIEASLKARQEEKERKRVEEAEEMAIRWLERTDPLEYQRLWRRHGLRYRKGLTDEQIDDLDRKEAAAQARGAWYPSGISNPLQNSLYFLERIKGKTQEQIDAMDREEAAARERRKNETPTKSRLFGPPLTQEELDAKHRTWDAWGVSKEEQAELVRMFGLKPEPEPEPGIADAPASERVSQPRASSPRPPKDTSRKTRGGRVTKSTARIQSVANRGTRSRQTAPTPAEAPIPNRRSKRQKASDMVDKPEDSTVQVPRQTRKRQPKVHKERVSGAVDDIDDKVLQSKHHDTGQRASRRLAHKPPQFGMFAEQSVTPPLHEPPVRNPSNASKPNSSGPRSRASPKKKSIAVKGAKPRGISKSGREGTNRPKRSKKGSEG
ncbi:uncharacterized protein PAC_15164 [Phialocephala subalpina]|uniref:Uncharacterized protein n=1 Tax=Phialocephala subalpina TaxID=576137 RepID=A0A1L7XJS9_9HELO|nr:uncharacterized protein PAC_15164 [Phialocephala subalpina]